MIHIHILIFISLLSILPPSSSSSSSPLHLPCSASDLAALQAFHGSLPSGLLSWPLHNASCCLWPRISCNSHAHVISLNLSNTNIHGTFPSIGISNLSSLSILDISHNPLLFGPFPSVLPSSLTYLDLSHCSFHGPIPSSISNSSNIEHLLIHHNFFSDLDAGISDLAHLQTLDASMNLFAGSNVLRKLSNLTQLRMLNFDGNHVEGPIPSEIGNLGNLRIFRLQRNGLVGSIPPEIVKCRNLCELWLDDNFLHGSIPELVWELPWITVLSLSNNRLEGNLPSSLPETSMLRFLSLSGNVFSGDVPVDLARLPHLEVLLLSRNRFSGVLPSRFKGSLKQLDVSGNKLEHPWIGENASTSLDQHTDSWLPDRRILKSGTESNPVLVGIISAIAAFLGILIIGAVIFVLCIYKRRQRNVVSRSIQPSVLVSNNTSRSKNTSRNVRRENSRIFDQTLLSISYNDLVKATDGFDSKRIIGDGGFGYVYSATLSNGRTVAVKKLDASGIQGEREFEAEMQTLGNIKHPNLVELMAYCRVEDERLLVYEFAENGSLDMVLHEETSRSSELSWRMRIKIAQGAARGLAYLHHDCVPHVLHRDIKSSNILLTKDFEPKIADFGFARNISVFKSHITTAGAGTLGYMPPEYCLNPVATRQADVYSFGMLLLELATGKRPSDLGPNMTFRTLTDWAIHMIQSGSEMELLDPLLLNDPPPYAHVTAFFLLACECTSETSRSRPRMKDVCQRLLLL